MPFCAAFGCASVHKKGCGVSFFSFPKDSARRKRYCRRDKFVPENHSRLCSKHFSTDQLERDPNVLERLGYVNARIKLKGGAIPDVPLRVQAAPLVLPPKTRGAFAKRNKPYLLHEALQEVELRNGNDATPVTIHHDGEAPPNSEPKTAVEVPEPEDPPVSSSQTCTTLTKKCQASITVPQRTRRIQVSMTDKNCITVSKGVQCSSLFDGVSLREAAGLVPLAEPKQEANQIILDEDTQSDVEEDEDQADSDYDPFEEEDEESDEEDQVYENGIPLRTAVHPEEERQFLVAESCLAKLLEKCGICGSPCISSLNFTRGTMVGTRSQCTCGHVCEWESQQCLNGMPWSNIFVAGAIVFSGSNAAKCLRLFQHLKLQMMSTSTFSRIQSAYVIPSCIFTWDYHLETLLQEYQGQRLTLGGDARCDSPGYSAKYGSYTLMDLETGKILDFQLVQSNEVKSSVHMELEGLKRGIQQLVNAGPKIDNIITDRHGMVRKFMRTEHPDNHHYFDVWHVAKGISKKLEAASKKRDCADIRPWIKSSVNHCYWVAASCGEDGYLKEQKWSSLTEHVTNKHEHCEHGVLEEDRLWIKEGSRAHKLFRDVVDSNYLMRDIPKLSPLHQTYGLEVYHSVVNSFAPKNTHFFYPAMMARLCVAALHFNENGSRHQAMTRAGAAKWQICYPKDKRGDHPVAKAIKTPITYEYIDILRINLVERRRQFPSYQTAGQDADRLLGYQPPSLTSKWEPYNKDQLVATRRSRFARQ